MANFNIHLTVAASTSAAAAFGIWYLRYAGWNEAGICFLLGTFGGLLPDIDADNSIPVRLVFILLAYASATFALLFMYSQVTIWTLSALWVTVFILVRYLVFAIFIRLTKHRGIFHSLLAVVFMTLLAAYLSYFVLANNRHVAWLHGYFIGFGYFVHLCLDELYSIDLKNARIKRSFGTALKLFSLNNPGASLLMFVLAAILFIQLPSAEFDLEFFVSKITLWFKTG